MDSVAALLALAVQHGVGKSFSGPAFAPLPARAVASEDLFEANALFSAAADVSMVLGPVLAAAAARRLGDGRPENLVRLRHDERRRRRVHGVVLLGACVALFSAPSRTIALRATPETAHGRVLGAWQAANSLGQLMPALAVPVFATLGTQVSLTGAGVLLTLAGGSACRRRQLFSWARTAPSG